MARPAAPLPAMLVASLAEQMLELEHPARQLPQLLHMHAHSLPAPCASTTLAYPVPPPVPLGSGGRRRCSHAPSASSLLQMRRGLYQPHVASTRAKRLPNQQPRPSPTGSPPTIATRRPGFESQALHSFLWILFFHCDTDALAPPVIHTRSHVAHGPTSQSNGWVQPGCI